MADSSLAALNSLLQKAGIEDHNEALRIANAAIKASPSSSGSSSPDTLRTAQHTKVVALLKLDRYDDVLRVVDNGGDRLARNCALEHAYALYKTGDLDRAASVCHDLPGRAARHLGAQIAYRDDRFDEAARAYRELSQAVAAEGRAGEEGDLRINMLAAAAQMEWTGRDGQGRLGAGIDSRRRQNGDNFETVYNVACGLMARGDFEGAAHMLQEAKELCEASEDLSVEERQTELVPILVQQTCALIKLGRTEEASRAQKTLTISKISDAPTQRVAQNNSLVLSQQQATAAAPYNPYMSQRVAESHTQPTGSNRLFEHQAAVLRRNKYVIELQCQKFKGVRSSTSSAAQSKKKNSKKGSVDSEATNLGVLHAAAVSHMQTGKDALKSILPLLDSRPDDIGLLLTIIQLYVQTKNPVPALKLLEALFRRLEKAKSSESADMRFAPGLVALAVALYRLQGRHAAVRNELAKAAKHWQGQTSGSEADSGASLLRQAGIELLQSQDPAHLSAAGAAFSQLCAEQPNDRLAEAGLVASFATNSSERSRIKASYLEQMTSVEQLTAGVNVQALIDAGVANLPPPPASAVTASSKKRGAETQGAPAGQPPPPAKKPRKRPSKLPKDFDPDKKPDPERWLPLKDRSTYRPKGGKKGKKRAEANTQGGVVREGDGETLELVGGAGAVKVEKATPQSSGGAKKKKKGKK